jgi:threonine/homoserine/homoserine lactone efflux protein
MAWETYLVFVAASTLMLLVPGPTVLLVSAQSLRGGKRATLPTVAGVMVGDALAITVSLAGLGALIATSAALFTALKWVGAAYLIWLGIRTLMQAPKKLGGAEEGAPATSRKMAGNAFVVTALNPKSIAFFVAFLPQFVDPSVATTQQLVIMAMSFVGLAGLTNLSYALAASRASVLIRRPLWQRVTQWTSGGALIGADVLTAAMRRA